MSKASDRTLYSWFRFMNGSFFDGDCNVNTCVRWMTPEESRKYSCFAVTLEDEGRLFILMDRERNRERTVRLATLAHEMIHVATELRDDHGPKFDEWHARITARGLFKKGAVLRGITLF